MVFRAVVSGCRHLDHGWCRPRARPRSRHQEIRARERDGLIELPKPPGLRRGDRVRITSGPFADHLALYQGQASHDRVAVLLQLLGGRQRTELPASAVEPVGPVMTLPEEECAFFFAAMAQLEPELRPIFAERVANILGAFSPFCEPGPGDVDRAIRAGAGRLVDPAGDRGGEARSRWDQATPKFERASKRAF